jgi:hypothetical protein
MTRALLLYCFVFCSTSGPAQTTTFNVVNHHLNMLSTAGGKSVFEQNDGYMVFSVQWQYDSTSSSLFVTKFDLDGYFMWERSYSNSQNTDFGLIEPVASYSDDGYAAALTFFGNNIPNSTHLYLFDNLGDTISTLIVKVDSAGNGNHGTRQLGHLADGGFIHSGWCQGGSGCITFLDQQGNYLFEQQYSDVRYILRSLPTLDGGHILCTGKSIYPDLAGIIKTDSVGNEQWRRQFGGHAMAHPVDIIQLQDGSFLVPGAYVSINTSLFEEDQYASLFKYGPGGEFLWRRDYFYGHQSLMVLIEQDTDQIFWLVGGRFEVDGDTAFVNKTTVMKVDTSGDPLWNRKYVHYNTHWSTTMAMGMQPTSDGGLVITGSTRQGYNDPQPLLSSNWLIKLDEHGCLVPGCHTVGVQEYALDLNQYFKVWPNPAAADGMITVGFEPPEHVALHGLPHLLLTDALGRVVWERPWASAMGELAVPLQGITSGLYHLHLHDGRAWLAGAKVVVE